ncbi:MAG TPA: hypothetical protein VGJ21_14795 [Terracidiphilus sp.]|jgi:hypothetical protein
MSENILQTLQHVVQDVIAPDVRELKANQAALEKQIAALEKHMDMRFEAADQKAWASDQKAEARFDALMAAISESRAQAELTNARVIAALSERVAVLEAQRH